MRPPSHLPRGRLRSDLNLLGIPELRGLNCIDLRTNEYSDGALNAAASSQQSRYHSYMSSCSSPRRAGMLALLPALLLHGGALAHTPSMALAPPSSLKPAEKVVSVQVSHQHRVVHDCAPSPARNICMSREVDGDTATSLRFERTGTANVGLDPDGSAVLMTFPHHLGPQEQSIRLAPGDWLVDWAGASGIAHLHVEAGAHPTVTLVTTTGACHLRNRRCELDPTRERQITMRRETSP